MGRDIDVWGGVEVLDTPRPDLALPGLLGEQLDLEVEFAQEAIDMVGLCAADFLLAAPIGWPGLGTLAFDGQMLRLQRTPGPTDWIDETADAFGADRAALRRAAGLVGAHAARAIDNGGTFDLPRLGRLEAAGHVSLSEKAAASLSKGRLDG